jgi:thiol-disulfide isomerase/thioredoxin
MSKVVLVLLLVGAFALPTFSQSGRRTTTARSAPAPPVQPPANPEPEINAKPVVTSGPLLFLPSSLLEREINALDNGTFRFDDFHGKVVVINIWASWCGPCRREVPEYERVRKSYEGREVEFMGLTTEDPLVAAARVKKFVRDVGFNFRIGWADRETECILMNGRNSIPQTLVIDGEGRVVEHWTGYIPRKSGDKLKQIIEHVLVTSQSAVGSEQ